MTTGATIGLPAAAAIPPIVVVGSMMVDQVTYCERAPEEGETLVAERHEQGFGGKGANQAVMAARLGASVALVGCVGGDDLGRATVANLADHGVDVSSIVTVDGAASGVAPIWVDRHGTNRILIVPGANAVLDAGMVVDALQRRPGFGVVIAQLETPQPASTASFQVARRCGATTVLNPAPAAPLEAELLAVTDWLVPNESEFEALFGSPPDIDAIAAGAAQRDHGVVVTLGAAGAIVSHRAATTLVPAMRAPAVVDTTGAGDAFVGAFATGLGAGLAPEAAARLGCAAASLSVRQPGTQRSFPSRAAVERLLITDNREEP